MDYVGRVKDLKTALLDCIKQIRGNVTRGTLTEIEQEVIDSFVNGLRPPVRTNLKIEKYTDLNDAIIKAIRISKTLDADRKRYGNRFDSSRNTNGNINNNSNEDNSQTNKNTSQSLQYRDNQPRNQRSNPGGPPYVQRNGNPTSSSTSQEFCQYCKKPGHNIGQCRTRAYYNSQRNIPEKSKSEQRRVNFLEETLQNDDPPSGSQSSTTQTDTN